MSSQRAGPPPLRRHHVCPSAQRLPHSVPRQPVWAAEEGSLVVAGASLWKVVLLLSRRQPGSLLQRSLCQRLAQWGAGGSRGYFYLPGRPRPWAGAERLRASPVASLTCPAARQCTWAAGGRWAPRPGDGGGCCDEQKQPQVPAALGPRALGAPASPRLSHGDLQEQHQRPRLLQPHRRPSRSHDDRGLPPPAWIPQHHHNSATTEGPKSHWHIPPCWPCHWPGAYL
jgi:hypothetical protein